MNPTNPTPHPQRGTRHRIVTPAAPAPVPAARPQVAKETSNDRSKLDRVPVRHKQPEAAVAAVDTSVAVAVAEEAAKEPTEAAPAAAPVASESDAQETSDSDVVRSTGSMAIATLVSRITGFLRTVLITTTLGGAIASAFNTGNTLPNLITEIVLGAVLTSLVVPVLVRAEKEDPDRGEAFIRRLFTLASTLLIAVTIIAVVSAPWLSRLMLHSDGKVNLFQTTSFAYLLLPQIYFYGIFALLMAVLNTKQIFKPGAWAPVANNVITIVVLVAYMLLPGEIDPDAPSKVTDPHVLLLGLGTTLGVVVQLLIMIPPIRRAGVSLKPLWGIDARLKQFGGMALAIIVYVAISQWGYIITTRIASHADAGAPNIYQQHWLLLQVPYGIIGVTLLTAIMPRLSRNAADGDDKAVVRDLVVGSKLTFIALIPIVVFFSAYGERIGVGLFAYRRFDVESASILGLTLAYSAFTLLPYALVLLHLRVFYAREEAWTPTFIIAGITGTKVVLSMLAPLVASDPSRVVILLGAANGFGFVSGALIGAMLLRRKLGNLGSREVTKTSVWALGSSLVGIVVALGLSMGMDRVAGGFFEFFGSVGMLIHLAIVGVVFLVVTALVLSRSGLEEVVSLGYALQRIPGMRRVIKMKAQQPADTIPTNEALAAQALTFDDTFNATPIPAPMSAGIVRGPRLVPGAQVSDGRFRLLADHGSVSTARFWHAREKATGRDVALVFVDTSGSAPQARQALLRRRVRLLRLRVVRVRWLACTILQLRRILRCCRTATVALWWRTGCVVLICRRWRILRSILMRRCMRLSRWLRRVWRRSRLTHRWVLITMRVFALIPMVWRFWRFLRCCRILLMSAIFGRCVLPWARLSTSTPRRRPLRRCCKKTQPICHRLLPISLILMMLTRSTSTSLRRKPRSRPTPQVLVAVDLAAVAASLLQPQLYSSWWSWPSSLLM